MPEPSDYWSDATRYRKGARDDEARAGHTADSTQWRHARADAAFPPAAQRALLKDVESGTGVSLAAARLGLTHQFVYAYARRNEVFGARLDTALWVAAPDCPHGTGNGYRHWGCHCKACRAAHKAEA